MSSRIINCPLYGFIDITPRMGFIIDTPEFKRLHNLRQLGATYLVYPSANHTNLNILWELVIWLKNYCYH